MSRVGRSGWIYTRTAVDHRLILSVHTDVSPVYPSKVLAMQAMSDEVDRMVAPPDRMKLKWSLEVGPYAPPAHTTLHDSDEQRCTKWEVHEVTADKEAGLPLDPDTLGKWGVYAEEHDLYAARRYAAPPEPFDGHMQPILTDDEETTDG